MPDPAKRLSITKLQRQSAAVEDLIAICQTVTEDGALSDDDVRLLHQWVDEHEDLDLPARAHLMATVHDIMADGRVTDEERHRLWEAVETVMPPDVRSLIRVTRQERDAAERERLRAERQAAVVDAREQAQRNKPIGRWNFMVAGVRHQGRPAAIEEHAYEGSQAFLVRDTANRHSRNAVAVCLPDDIQIGFVPEDYAVEVAPLLDQGCQHVAVIKKILTNGRSPIPVVDVRLFRPDATVETEARPTAPAIPPPQSGDVKPAGDSYRGTAQHSPSPAIRKEPARIGHTNRQTLAVVLVLGSIVAWIVWLLR